MEDEELEYEEHEEEPEWKKRLKKVFVAVIGIFLLLLVITYFLPDTTSIMVGKIVSERLDENFSAELQNGNRVVFTKEAYAGLKSMFLEEQRREFAACLQGSVKEGSYFVDSVYKPEIFSQSHTHVSSARCDDRTIISLHTHPHLRCIFSDADISYYRSISSGNPEVIIALMCDIDRLNFYFE